MSAITTSYDITLVALSYVISVFGAYTALQLAIGIPAAQGKGMVGWLIGAALAMGGGAIWSMHFIGMLAFEVDMPVAYDPVITLVSAIIAVAVTGIGLFVVGRGEASAAKLLMGGVFAGLGVAGMHYTGMAAAILSPTGEGGVQPVLGVSTQQLGIYVFGIAGVLLTAILLVGMSRSRQVLELD